MINSKIFQTAKIVMAAFLAIALAMAFKLEFAVSAGIITILSIQKTKKETLSLAVGRFLAFLAALALGLVGFTVFGYNLWGFTLYLLLFIFVCQYFSWHSAMAVDSVLISHFLTFDSMAPEYLLNEVLLFLIGVGFGILANLHLRKDVLTMDRKMTSVDDEIRGILKQMSEHILKADKSEDNGACFKRLNQLLFEAKKTARENQDNQWRTKDSFDLEYVLMREKQCAILLQMYKNIGKVKTTPVQAKKISHLLENMSTEYEKENTVAALYEEWEAVVGYMKEQPLPLERPEFESRALLYGLLCEIEGFLLIKRKFSKEHFEKTL